MKINEIEPQHEKVKEAEARKTQKEIDKEVQDFNQWRKLKVMSEWLCLILLKTYWIMFEGILTWIGNQWKVDREKEINALQIFEVKRREADTQNSAQEVKSRNILKDQSIVIEERKTLLSYLDKLSYGENCVEQEGTLRTYDKFSKHSQEAAVQEVFFNEKEIKDLNYQNSSKKNKDMIFEASNEEPCILKTDVLCMFSGSTSNGQQFDNVLIHVDEEVRLLEEMAGIEKYFEHVFNNFDNNGIDGETIIKEAEDK